MNLNDFNKNAQLVKKENQLFFKRLSNRPPKNLDELFHEAHEEIFEKTDCLSCANCCKTTSPIFYQKDVERASKAVKLRPGAFVEKYLREDEDKDLVLQQAPCPFLNTDNYCGIYNDRPNACREYPHTNRKKMYQILDLTFKNTLVCPAVLKITDMIKKKLLIMLAVAFLVSCSGSENKNRKINASFDKEIGNRIKILNKDSVQTDSLKVNPNEVDSIVNTFILLSKDIENISASINKSNQYFNDLASQYKLSAHDFIKVKNGMHVDDIATTLKQNELSFFNLILLKNNKSDLLLHAAQ